MTTYLITGGAGFIGSHLAEKLLSLGHQVLAIDDLSTGSRDNIKHLESNKKFYFIQETALNGAILEELICKADIICHLAAAVGVKLIINEPIRSINTNFYGTETVLKIASKYKRKILLASTSEVYGKNDKQNLKESDDRVLGDTNISRWSYSCTKALDEFLGFAYYKKENLPVIVVRFFNICGPRQTGKYGMVIPRFIKAALEEKPIPIFGDGSQTRSFTYIDDAVEGIIMLLNNEKAVGEIFNLGAHNGITILDLAYKVKEVLKSKSSIEFIPYEKAYEKDFEDMRYRVPNIDKIKNCLGYSPKIGIEEIIKRTAKFYKEKESAVYHSVR
ncbi:GDP-mannose 4,6-dehydratase [Candidatus Auribacterota bacterium]